jgi:hypothetical protein
MILATGSHRNAQFVAKTQRFVAPKRRSIAPNGAWVEARVEAFIGVAIPRKG